MKEIPEEISFLLEEIQDWMIDNDYESGEHGGHIYNRICEVLQNYAPKDKV